MAEIVNVKKVIKIMRVKDFIEWRALCGLKNSGGNN